MFLQCFRSNWIIFEGLKLMSNCQVSEIDMEEISFNLQGFFYGLQKYFASHKKSWPMRLKRYKFLNLSKYTILLKPIHVIYISIWNSFFLLISWNISNTQNSKRNIMITLLLRNRSDNGQFRMKYSKSRFLNYKITRYI